MLDVTALNIMETLPVFNLIENAMVGGADKRAQKFTLASIAIKPIAK